MFKGENCVNTVLGNGLLLLSCQISPYIKDNLLPFRTQKQTLVINVGLKWINGNCFFWECKHSYNETWIFGNLIVLRFRVEEIMSEIMWVLDENAWKGPMC